MKINFCIIVLLYFCQARSMEILPAKEHQRFSQMSEEQMIKQLDSLLKEMKLHSSSVFYRIQCQRALEYAAEYDYRMFADHAFNHLKKHCFPLSIPRKFIQKSFFTAVQKGNIPLVKRFLMERKDIYKECMWIDSENKYIYTYALDIAAEMGNLELAQELVQAGDNANRPATMSRDTPLSMAIHDYNMNAIRILLLVGADPDLFSDVQCVIKRFKKEFNPLMEAAVHPKGYDAFELLLNGVEYPPELIVALRNLKNKRTYFSFLPAELLMQLSPYLFKIQANPNKKSGAGTTMANILAMTASFFSERDSRWVDTPNADKMMALLQSKMATKIEKPKITPMQLYKLSQ